MIVSSGRRWMDKKVSESCNSGYIWISIVILFLIPFPSACVKTIILVGYKAKRLNNRMRLKKGKAETHPKEKERERKEREREKR